MRDSFKGVACATPNEAEAALATGIEIVDENTAAQAAKSLREMMDAEWVFMTRGNLGMMIAGRDGSLERIPIIGPRDIVDVAGAGDTVAAVVTLCLACGVDTLTAGCLAAYAASIVCMKTGVATATVEEIRAAVEEYPPVGA